MTEVFLNLTEVFLTLTEVFPCFFLSCKANARVKLAKTGHGPHSSTLDCICVVRLLLFVLFGCYLCCSMYCLCVNVYCHRVTTQLQLINISNKNGWLYEGAYGFRPGFSCECQVITVCQVITDSLEEGIGIDAIIIDFSKAFDLVPHDRLLTKLAASGVD